MIRPLPTAVREAAGLGQQEGMFRCSKCRGKNTDFYQKQTRSADGEGVTSLRGCHWKSESATGWPA